MVDKPELKVQPIVGLICAPFTPFDARGEVDVRLIPAYARCLRENGIAGVFVNGTTGEGLLMTDEERRLTAETWRRECDDEFKLIVHVGSTSIKSAVGLAAHAEAIGAAAISAMAPVFPPVTTVAQVCGFCEQVAAAAPTIPFYYYHIPSMSRVAVPMVKFVAEAALRIPTFAGVKFTSIDLYEMNRCALSHSGRFDILSGVDEIMIAALGLANPQGFVGGTFNYYAPLYTSLIDAFRRGDITQARALQNKSQDIVDILHEFHGNMVAGKYLMRMVGLDVGEPRSPLQRLSDREQDALKSRARAVGFEEFCVKVSPGATPMPGTTAQA